MELASCTVDEEISIPTRCHAQGSKDTRGAITTVLCCVGVLGLPASSLCRACGRGRSVVVSVGTGRWRWCGRARVLFHGTDEGRKEGRKEVGLAWCSAVRWFGRVERGREGTARHGTVHEGCEFIGWSGARDLKRIMMLKQ